MSQDGRQSDSFLSKVALDMKALALLHPSDAELRAVIRAGLLDSHDEQLDRVIHLLNSERPEKTTNSVALALGQLLLGSFLMVAGIVAIAPFMMGVSDTSALVKFFGAALSSATSAPAFFPVLPELVILLSVALLLSAFYALRSASTTLRDAGYINR